MKTFTITSILLCLLNIAACLSQPTDCLEQTKYISSQQYSLWVINQLLYQITNKTVSFSSWGEADCIMRPNPRAHILQMEIQNLANNLTQVCKIDHASLETPTGDKWYPCHNETQTVEDKYQIQTYVQFLPGTQSQWKVSVRQTYFCSESGNTTDITSAPKVVKVSAHATLPWDLVIFFRPILCGTNTHSILEIPYRTGLGFVSCNITYDARWCSLGGDINGRKEGGIGMGVWNNIEYVDVE
ncbi:hypothetical protein QBC38DRAFT_459183 [Podospora fimiseda]|uniref:Uncharacterized protein n=1 Tax=Podospora fimiseda TaxID=252190 RepID=A0AAN7BHY3_9PEZI|nr:hypothetical protein QBC38DRAFT_459183 [Podospora fimiseda]